MGNYKLSDYDEEEDMNTFVDMFKEYQQNAQSSQTRKEKEGGNMSSSDKERADAKIRRKGLISVESGGYDLHIILHPAYKSKIAIMRMLSIISGESMSMSELLRPCIQKFIDNYIEKHQEDCINLLKNK